MKGLSTIVRGIFFTIIAVFYAVPTMAQDSCTYRLRLYDRYGDGWDDSQLYVRTGNNAEKAFTHDGIRGIEADSIRLYDIRVKPNDTIVVRYDPQGAYQNEIRFTLFNNAGEPILTLGPTPRSGIVYSGRIKCVVCGAPRNFKVNSVRAFTTTIQWDPAFVGFQPSYRIEWDSVAFTPGIGTAKNMAITTDTFAILPGLAETTRYFAYVKTICNPASDTSGWVGPVQFRTDTAVNVGISAIIGPIGTCNLGVDSVRVKIKNFGGAPLSLIPFTYSVNGVKANVSMPSDGLWTGVISKDSTVTYAFKATYNFSQAGEYDIAAWTEVKTDKNKRNDTFRTTLVRPLLVNQFPYQQNFETGKGTWSKSDSIGNSTWEYGTPRFRFIQGAASGTRCWTTAADTSYRNSDTSYLLSPCLDFSTITADPRISFALNFYTEARFDGAWLEGSIDGGKTWAKVGRRGTGINWYNDSLSRQNFDLWTGTTVRGWKLTQNTLTGMAGKKDCRLRFVFRSDNTTNAAFDGVAIDNINISAPLAVDLAMDSIGRVDISDCGNARDTMQLRIFNLGTTAQSVYTLNVQVDNNTPVSETIQTVSIDPSKSILYKMKVPINTALSTGTHTIKAWVTQANDNARVNDTAMTTYFISPVTRGNTVFNFDNGVAPLYWSGVRASLGIGRHGNAPTNGYGFANIFADTAIVLGDTIITPNAQLFDVTTNKFGLVRADDSLKYDYRFVLEDSPFGAYDLVNKDTLRVMVAEECSPNFTIIDRVFRSNHTPTEAYRTRTLSLKQFEGKVIKIRMQVTSDINTYSGYFIDIDNVNYKSICPASFGIATNIRRANAGQSNGFIALRPTTGRSPYTYLWNTGSTRDSIGGLSVGSYTVTVTDANGCIDVQTYRVDAVSPTFDASSTISKVVLRPNPTSGSTYLDVELNKVTDARVQVLNLVGQVILEQQQKQTDKAQFELDLSDKPSGVYLVRITADNKTHIARLVKQ
jgi:hypothetical protein